MKNKNVMEQGFLEKEQNAKKLRLKKLQSIGISSEDELNSILFDKKFNIENRVAKYKNSINSEENILKPIPEDEKCERLKAYEKLIKEEVETLNTQTKEVMGRATEERPYYVINKTGKTLYTNSGQPLYNKEVCVRFPAGNKIYMMRTNGTMGYEYLSSSNFAQSNFRRINDMLWAAYGHISSRADVGLYDYNASYFGYVSKENSFKGGGMWVLEKLPLLMSIMDYSANGAWCYKFDGFLETNLNVFTHMDKLNVYGDPSKL